MKAIQTSCLAGLLIGQLNILAWSNVLFISEVDYIN